MSNKKIIILGVVIVVVVSIVTMFYVFNSKKTATPISSNTYENQTQAALEKQPSKDLKEYSDDAGFSFQYPNDVQVGKIEIKDSITYSSLELTSNQAKGKILIKIADTRLASVNDWFAKEAVGGNIKEIKIGEISGGQLQMDNKILAAAINQNILFTIGADTQNQKYWQSVYDIVLSSFNFVTQEGSNVSEAQSSSDSSDDAILEEEIVE